jgi:Anti-sigma factor NepR
MLSRIGRDLRGLYQDLLDEPLPEFLAVFIRDLENREQDGPETAQN